MAQANWMGTVSNPELFFRYCAGRWLWNESAQLSRRFRKFNIPELLKAGVSAVGSASCVGVEKLPEGNFNKALLLHMNDGKNVVAKIPNPNAGRPHFTTASEVATMDFSPVGSEYILMETAQGRPLAEFWTRMKGRDKVTIVQQIVDMESKFGSMRFPMYGSLYYAGDSTLIPGSEVLQLKVPRKFVVGPTTGRATFDDKRAEINADHGPCKISKYYPVKHWTPAEVVPGATAEEYFYAIVNREKACIESFDTSPRPQGIFDAPGLYRPTPAAKLSVLSKVKAVIPALLSTGESDLSSAMWHSDLHSDNIFVDPDEPTRITAVIDWQAVHLGPLFLQARHPSLLEVDGPIPEGLTNIELPKDFDQLNITQQRAAKELRAAQSLLKIYELNLFKSIPSVYQALQQRPAVRNQILGLIGSVFDDGEPILEGMLILLCDEWDKVMASLHGDSMYPSCPLYFSAEDRSRHAENQSRWERSVELMSEVTTDLGVPRGWDGWVSHDEYHSIREHMVQVRESFLRQHAASDDEREKWAASWPFGGF
nr:altered inheritance of mitochondria protein 9, mitochondrial [Quercus suber]